MHNYSNYDFRRNQSGVSLVELLVAMAIFGLVLTIGFSLYSYLNQSRGKALEQLKVQEQYLQAFNLFYRTYNQTFVSDPATGTVSNYVNLIESTSTQTQIQFISGETSPSLSNSIITIGNGDSSLSNLLNYFVVPPVNESTSMCMLTGNSSGNTWNYRCPDSYNGIQTVFANTPITHLPIAFIDGMICYVTPPQSGGTLSIDPIKNNCTFDQINKELSAFNQNWFFELPRIMVFSKDQSFQQPIFESLISPRYRFATHKNHYPASF